MKLFMIKGGAFIQLHEKPFKTERDIQQTTKQNLETTLGLQYVKSKLAFNNIRIHTLAYNSETNAFTIMESKKKLGTTATKASPTSTSSSTTRPTSS